MAQTEPAPPAAAPRSNLFVRNATGLVRGVPSKSSVIINFIPGHPTQTLAAVFFFALTLAPGGNDSLVLYAIPTLSPHALPTYAALALGIATGLLTIRRLLGIETHAECRNDLYFGALVRRSEAAVGRREDPDLSKSCQLY